MGIKDWFKRKDKQEKKNTRDIEGVESFEEWQAKRQARAEHFQKISSVSGLKDMARDPNDMTGYAQVGLTQEDKINHYKQQGYEGPDIQ